MRKTGKPRPGSYLPARGNSQPITRSCGPTPACLKFILLDGLRKLHRLFRDLPPGATIAARFNNMLLV
jgi:hypothetical protein